MIRMLWREIQTIAGAALVAALLWLYAEGATVKPQPIQMDLQLVQRQGQHLRITEPAGTVPLHLEVPCTAGQYANLQGMASKPFAIELPSDAAEQSLSVKTILLADRRFADLGIRTLSAHPDSVLVKTVALLTLKLPIRVASGKLEFSGEPKLSVTEATLASVPANLARLAPNDAVLARIDPDKVDYSKENVEQSLEVPLELPQGLRGDRYIDLSPKTVTVTFILRRGTRELVITQPVPVVPSFSSTDYTASIDISQWPQNLKVVGPVEVIDKLEKDLKGPPESRPRIYGSVRLTSDDLTKPGTIPKQVDGFIGLPGTVSVTSLPTVQVTITKIPASPPPPAPGPPAAAAGSAALGPPISPAGAAPAPAVNVLVGIPLANNPPPATQPTATLPTSTQPSR